MMSTPHLRHGQQLRGVLANVPIPEPILSAIVVGVVLRYLAPVNLVPRHPIVTAVGAALIVLGGAIIVWSTATASGMRIAEPDRLLTTGPYRLSRNPMYAGWLAVALGLGLVLRALWVILGTTVAFLYLHHVTIPNEEQALKARFGKAYAAYHDRVPRYL